MRLLDCTLRDGGYVNNWNYSENCFRELIDTDIKLGIDTIEIGILGGDEKKASFSTKFFDFNMFPQIISDYKDTNFAIMGTVSEFKKINVPHKSNVAINTIRLAFFKSDLAEALCLAQSLIEKGYRVFLQAMATFMYSNNELIHLLREVNRVCPYAFYIVDSFGTMYPDDVKQMYSVVDEILEKDIFRGFHAHNNMQLAFANSLKFMDVASESSYVDASYYGMGRGAGNLGMELILRYIKEKKEKEINIDLCFELIEKYFHKEMIDNSWGYSITNFYSSLYRDNSSYLWYIQNMGISDIKVIREILQSIPDNARYSLMKDRINPLISKFTDTMII